MAVENQNGSVGVSALRGACNDVSIKTSFGSIKVGVPSSAGYKVDARTSFGSINTELPMTISQKSDNSVAGTIGSGTCHMQLVNSNGGITITRE